MHIPCQRPQFQSFDFIYHTGQIRFQFGRQLIHFRLQFLASHLCLCMLHNIVGLFFLLKCRQAREKMNQKWVVVHFLTNFNGISYTNSAYEEYIIVKNDSLGTNLNIRVLHCKDIALNIYSHPLNSQPKEPSQLSQRRCPYNL